MLLDPDRIDALVGVGGMATVYRATHAVLGSTHALKVLAPELVLHDDIRRRFLAEGRIQAQLAHPGIATVTDVVNVPGIAALVVEFIPGRSLAEHLHRSVSLSEDEACDILLGVLEAVGYAHAHGVVHRDLKPSNIVLANEPGSAPVVLDFGIAKLLRDDRVEGVRISRTGSGGRMGTPAYMSPEQIRQTVVDARTDVFALGAMLFELATGQVAFTGESDWAIQERIVAGRLPDLAALSPELGSVVRRALATDPDERLSDCRAFAEAIEAARRARHLAARRVPRTVEVPRPAPRSPRLAAGLFAAALVAAAVSVLVAAWSTVAGPGGPGAVAGAEYPMVAVAPGDFWMGSHSDEPGRDDDELHHLRAVPQGFSLGAVEVSRGLYRSVMGSVPGGEGECAAPAGGDAVPVVCVSWDEAVRFANALSDRDGYAPAYAIDETGVGAIAGADGYRLPTEAEWEYAGRAGAGHRWSGTDEPAETCRFANVADRSRGAGAAEELFPCDDGYSELAPVGSLRPNAWGLYDMTGNVWEWVWDEYAPYGDEAVATDGPARRVYRGGSFYRAPPLSRIANRAAGRSTLRADGLGFRLARTPR